MNAIVVGVLAFLVVSPAICDEGPASDKNSNEKEMVFKNPQPYYNSLTNQEAYGDSWFDREVRAPNSGFYGVRGKKDYDDDDWFMVGIVTLILYPLNINLYLLHRMRMKFIHNKCQSEHHMALSA